VTFPAARERHVCTRDFLCHHPEREDLARIWTKTVAAVFLRHYGREQPGAEEIVEVFGRKGGRAIVLRRTGGEVFAREYADAIDQILLLGAEIELRVGVSFEGRSCH